MKAAERAGCAIAGEPPDYTRSPLEIDSRMRVDVDGLDDYLQHRHSPPDPTELSAIQRLRTLARRP